MTDKASGGDSTRNLSLAWLLLFVMAMAWGTTWPFMKIAVAEIPVLSFRSLNVIGGAAALLSVSWIVKRRFLPRPDEWRRIALIGFFNITLWFLLSAVSLQTLPAGRAALLAFSTPLWAMLIEWTLFRSPFTAKRTIGIILALAVLSYKDVLSATSSYIGIIAILAASFSQTFGAVLQQRSKFDSPLFTLIGWQMLIGGIPILIGTAIFDDMKWVETVSREAILATTSITFFSICFGVIAWYNLLRITHMGFAAVGSLVVPFAAVSLSALMIGEFLSPEDMIGLVLITAAIAAAAKRNRHVSS